MKKTGLIALFALFVTVIMIGCGSNSKSDPLPPPAPTSPYMLTNVTSPFDIGYASQEQDFQVQLLKDGYPAVGETVSVGYLPANFGFVSNATAETDAGGYATFKYIAADSLTDGVQSLEIYHEFIPDSEGGSEDDLETFISVAYLSINVQNGSTPFDYKFINATSQIIINNSGDQEQISIELVDINNEPVAGKTVTITAPETGYGSVDPRSSITNAVGGANFTYTAPNDVRGLTSTTLTVSFSEHGNETTQDIQIIFQSAGYRFENPSTPIMITAPQQAEVISVYLMDENNKPVSGKTVSITPLDSRYGIVDPLQMSTGGFGVAGEARFNYTAPDDIRDLGSITATISFTDEFDQTITQDILIQFGGTNNYQLVNAKDPYYVYSAIQTDMFDIQLINNGLPVISPRACVTDTTNVTTDCVMPYAIDRRFGRLQGIASSSGQGESDGYVYYNYLPPTDDEKAANGEDTTFTVIYIDINGVVMAESAPVTLRMRY